MLGMWKRKQLWFWMSFPHSLCDEAWNPPVRAPRTSVYGLKFNTFLSLQSHPDPHWCCLSLSKYSAATFTCITSVKCFTLCLNSSINQKHIAHKGNNHNLLKWEGKILMFYLVVLQPHPCRFLSCSHGLK